MVQHNASAAREAVALGVFQDAARPSHGSSESLAVGARGAWICMHACTYMYSRNYIHTQYKYIHV